ncbi:MAG TPA: EamA family transporter [Vicinamibacteria bacterium]|jgi:drug/metabolite transporter (DMT)-like permease
MVQPRRALVALAFGLVCLIWGTTWAAIQIGLRGIPPFSGVAIRFAIAATVLLAVAWATGVRLGRTRRERMLWLGNGILSFIIAYGVVYWSEQWIPSGLAAVLFATYPLFVAIVGHFGLPNEAVSPRELVGIAVGFGGVGVIFSEDVTLGGPEVYLAALVMLISPLAAAFGTVAVKRWGSGIHPFSLAGGPMAVASGVMGMLAVWLERTRTFVWNFESIGSILYLAICGSAVAFFLYYWLLSILPAKRLALTAYIIPLVAVLVGMLRGESFHSQVLVGGALVVTGVALAVGRRRS